MRVVSIGGLLALRRTPRLPVDAANENDEQYFGVYAGPDGAVLFEEPNPSRTRTEEPLVADVDLDGNAEIVFVANTEAAFAGDAIDFDERIPGLEIWGSGDDAWIPARPIWNQHTYHVDNVEDDGSIPIQEAGGWQTHNTYRANQPGDAVVLYPDLTGVISPFDESRCAEGILRVCAAVRNTGEFFVGPDILVRFLEGNPAAGNVVIGETATTRSLGPGEQEIVCADWANAPAVATDVWLEIDIAGAARECDEENNTVYLGPGRCPGIE